MSSRASGGFKKPAPKQNGKLRIIGGTWRGRKLPIADVEGLRPTGDRMRETLFNWLQGEVYGARCLDLFAGSGALGFEALSRGASHCDFVESNSLAAKQLQHNAELLHAEARIHTQAAEHFLQARKGEAYSLVFIDPPFSQSLWESTFDTLSHASCLADNALIYVEAPAGAPLAFPRRWALQKSKTSGQVVFSLFEAAN